MSRNEGLPKCFLTCVPLLSINSPDVWNGWFLWLLQSWLVAANPAAAGRGSGLLWERQWVFEQHDNNHQLQFKLPPQCCLAPPTSYVALILSYSVVYILFFHELWINCSRTKLSADIFFVFSQRASSLRSSETSCWRSCSLTGEWRGGRKYFQVSLWQIWWGVLCSESSSSFSFSVCTPLIPRPSHIVRCEQRRCELLYSLKKVDFIKERVTCGAF